MKKRMVGFLILLFAAAVFTGCSRGAGPANTAGAVNVEGVSIPLGEVNFYLRYQQTQMQSWYGAYFGEDFMNQDLTGMGIPYGASMRDTVADTLAEYYVVEAHAEELGVSLTDEEKNRAWEAAKAFLAANDSKTLKAMSADETTVTHVLELVALQSKVYDDRAATIDTEVNLDEVARKRISYVFSSTEGEADEEGNVTDLTEDELARKKTQMEELLAEAVESKDLNTAAEARELTADSVTYGKDDSVLNETVLSAADVLSDGEFSDVIEAEDGYYIVYMETTYDEEATQTATENLLSQREREAYDAWYEPLKEAAEITKNDEVLESLTFERIFQVKNEEAEEESVEG